MVEERKLTKELNKMDELEILHPKELKFPMSYKISCWDCGAELKIDRNTFINKEKILCETCGAFIITPKFLFKKYYSFIEREINPEISNYEANKNSLSALDIDELEKILKQFNINREVLTKIRKNFISGKKFTVRHLIYLMLTDTFIDRIENKEKYRCKICGRNISRFNRYILDYSCGGCYKKIKNYPVKIFFPDYYKKYIEQTTKYFRENNPNNSEHIRKIKSVKMRENRNSYDKIIELRKKLLISNKVLNPKLVNSVKHRKIVSELLDKYNVPADELIKFDKLLYEYALKNGYKFINIKNILDYIKRYYGKSVKMKCNRHGITYTKYRPLSLENFYKWKVFNAMPEELFGCPICMKKISKGKSVEQNLVIAEITDTIKEIIGKQFNLTFVSEKKFVIGNKTYSWDLYIPELKLAVEYDSIFWHSTLWADKYGANTIEVLETLLKRADVKLKFERKNKMRTFKIFDAEWKNEHKKELWKNLIIRYILKETKNQKLLSELFKIISCDELYFEIGEYEASEDMIKFHEVNNLTGAFFKKGRNLYVLNGYDKGGNLAMSYIVRVNIENDTATIVRQTIRKDLIVNNIYTKCIRKIKELLKEIISKPNIKFAISGRLNNLKPIIPNFNVIFDAKAAPHLYINGKFVKISKDEILEYFKSNKPIVITISLWIEFFK